MKNSMFFKKFPSLLGGLVFTLATFATSAAQATFYFVATNGDDSSTGSEASPFRTIKRGVTGLSAGDTLYVKAGTYNESIVSEKTPIPNGTSWDNPVTVAAYPGDTVTVQPNGVAAFFWIMDGQDKYLIIDGFIIDGRGQAYHGFKFMRGTTHVRVQNSEIKNAARSGILVTHKEESIYGVPADTYHEFINLHVHHNGTDKLDHGFYITTSRNLVEHCHMHDNSNYGGKFYMSQSAGGGGSANYNIFRYNITHDNGTSSTIQSVGWLLSSGKGNQAYGNIAYNEQVGFAIGSDATENLLYNNIAYNNSLYGIQVFGDWGGSDRAMVFNNTVYNNPLYGIGVRTGGKNTIIKNNISYNNGTTNSANIWLAPDQSPGTIEENNLQINPKFVDPLKQDFTLQPGSPAIDNGVNITEVKVDFAGVERAQGKAYDIGAFEMVVKDDSTAPVAPQGLTVLQ